MKKYQLDELPLIGWREWLSLPNLNIDRIKAKVDSGARTSSLQSSQIKITEKNGKEYVSFVVYPKQKTSQKKIECIAQVVDWRNIKSSNGKVENRPIIRTPIILLDQIVEIEISLTSRVDMGFRMLLGREATRGRFNIATGASFLDKKLIPSTKKSVKRKKREK